MAKGYWIARVDVHNDDGYKPYAAANPDIEWVSGRDQIAWSHIQAAATENAKIVDRRIERAGAHPSRTSCQ